ncbi:hypothetical protein, partial [Pseudescherichia sp.]|uniref:hypothetical protein n=1 Tax=Pseudescherichia sp. TaxID=2055881 RepID=UPI00289E10D7
VFECPHRLSDKLLKSSATWLSAHRCKVAYITLSSFRVKRLFSLFSAEVPEGASLTGRLIRRCSVSVEAHYRELFGADKR